MAGLNSLNKYENANEHENCSMWKSETELKALENMDILTIKKKEKKEEFVIEEQKP